MSRTKLPLMPPGATPRERAREALRGVLGWVGLRAGRAGEDARLDRALDALVDFVDDEIGERTKAKLERDAERAEELDGEIRWPIP